MVIKEGVIYIAKNKINNKVYIGQSIHFYYRKAAHKYSSKKGSNCYFHKAIKKHGWNNFEWAILDSEKVEAINEVLAIKILINKLNEKEIYWIKKYNSSNGSYGYNLTEGGRNSSYSHTKESKAKLSLAHKGKKLTSEHIKNISKATKGINNPFYGKKHTEESKKKMSLNSMHWLGRKHSEESKKKMSKSKKGTKHTEATKKKLSEFKKDKTIYLFIHKSGLKERLTRTEMKEKYNLKNINLLFLKNKPLKTHKGWSVVIN
jgi:group I intron endonuclease